MAIDLAHEFNLAMDRAHKETFGSVQQKYWLARAQNLALARQTQELGRIAKALEEGNKK